MPPAGKKKKKNENVAHSSDLSGDLGADEVIVEAVDVRGDVDEPVGGSKDVPLLENFDVDGGMNFVVVKDKMDQFSSRLRKLWIDNGTDVFHPEEFMEFGACIDGFGGLIMGLMEENAKLRGILTVCTSGGYVKKITEVAVSAAIKAVAPARVAVPVAASTAVRPAVTSAPVSVVSSMNVSKPLPKPVETWSVVVRGKKGVSSKEVMEKVVEHIGPTLGVRVHEVKMTRDGGAVIRTPTVNEREKLVKNRKFKELGLEVSVNERPGPRVVVSQVRASISPEVFMADLFEMNFKDSMTIEEFRKRVRLVSKPWSTERPGELLNVVLEGEEDAMRRLLGAERVYIQWYGFKARLQDSVPHCFRCLGFDHRIRECKKREAVCRWCGMDGHLAVQCGNAVRCRNCAFRGQPADHSMLSYACPIYAGLLARANARH